MGWEGVNILLISLRTILLEQLRYRADIRCGYDAVTVDIMNCGVSISTSDGRDQRIVIRASDATVVIEVSHDRITHYGLSCQFHGIVTHHLIVFVIEYVAMPDIANAANECCRVERIQIASFSWHTAI